MQKPWSASSWLPTIRPDRLSYHEWQPPSLDNVNKSALDLVRLTSNIMLLPYDPENWILRARLLNALGYPELATGDAHKARMLVNAGSTSRICRLRTQVRLVVGMKLLLVPSTSRHDISIDLGLTDIGSRVDGTLQSMALDAWTVLIEGLKAANAYVDQIVVCREATKLFGKHATAIMWDALDAQHRVDYKTEIAASVSDLEREGSIRNGSILGRPYPWMTADIMNRSSEVVDTMDKQMHMVSNGSCSVRNSHIQEHQLDNSLGEDVMGVFAQRDIAAGEVLFVDRTASGVTMVEGNRCSLCCAITTELKAAKCPGCTKHFCSTDCLAAATLAGHLAACTQMGKPVKYAVFGKESPKHFSRNVRAKLLLRYLEFAVQNMKTMDIERLHPLQVLPMMRLTPKYTGLEIVPFSLVDDIIMPINMLQSLGIDIFAKHRFDTWVLFTMRLRLNNNLVGISLPNKDYIYGVYPMMAILNHSCDPSVVYSKEGEDATIVITAVRDIAKGEEVFTSYLSEPQELSLEERRAALMAWFGTACRCDRCLKESPS